MSGDGGCRGLAATDAVDHPAGGVPAGAEALRGAEGRPPCRVGIPFFDQPGVCDGCGKKLTGRQKRWCGDACAGEWWRQHDWGWARNAARRRDGQRCVTCGDTRALEVNHIEPRVGQGYGWGCWNHQDNLETLCHRCHVEVTKRQAEQRRAMFLRLDEKLHPLQDMLPIEVSS